MYDSAVQQAIATHEAKATIGGALLGPWIWATQGHSRDWLPYFVTWGSTSLHVFFLFISRNAPPWNGLFHCPAWKWGYPPYGSLGHGCKYTK